MTESAATSVPGRLQFLPEAELFIAAEPCVFDDAELTRLRVIATAPAGSGTASTASVSLPFAKASLSDGVLEAAVDLLRTVARDLTGQDVKLDVDAEFEEDIWEAVVRVHWPSVDEAMLIQWQDSMVQRFVAGTEPEQRSRVTIVPVISHADPSA